MLLLYISLLSCCFSGSMGSTIQEFQENFKALIGPASKEIFLPVPAGKFQCNHVPCHLERAVEQLKVYFKNDPMRTHVSLMEKNMDRIISTLNKAHTKPEKDRSCQVREVTLRRALKRYRSFFRKLQEECQEPS